MAEERDRRSWSDKDRDERKAKENATRDERKAKDNATRDERRAKEAESRARSQGKTPKATTERRESREEAKGYGIDTRGMSTREIKGAVSEAKAVEEDMMKFIEKSLNNLTTKKGGDLTPAGTAPTVTSRTTEDRPNPIVSNSGGPKGRGGGGGGSIPDPPPQGVYVYGSINGVVQWIETTECG